LKCKPFYDSTKINANDQLDLIGSCLSGCFGSGIEYTYSIYMLNNVTNQWISFSNSSFFYQTGSSNSDLTVFSDTFMKNPKQVIWMIKLNVYISSRNVSGSFSIVLYVNFPPMSGTCNVNPISFTTSTFFTIHCFDWIDQDGFVVSYAYYGICFFNIYSGIPYD
jgi:hypothetical protein